MSSRTSNAMRVVIVVSLFLLALPAGAASEQPWVFEGGGWGHGVGMSQYGVKGQVEEGRSVEEVLAYYYTGSSTGSLPGSHWTNDPEGLRIGLIPTTSATGSPTAIDLEAVGPGTISICHPSSDCSLVDEDLTDDDIWYFDVREDPVNTGEEECRVRKGSGVGSEEWDWGECDATVTQPADTATRIKLNGTEYAHGTLYMTPSAVGFHTVLALPLEKYLYGLAEMPSSWPADALEVQAIAGRSYAVATALDRGGSDGTSTSSGCDCHLYATTIDQAYAGWSNENPANGGQAWTDAVDATDGDLITHPDSTREFDVVKAFYSSSNGGASENNEDVWGGSPIPWLRSVDDEWSADPSINPLASWVVSVTDEDMASYFGWDRALDAFVLEGPPGVLVQFTGSDNGSPVSTTLNGSQMATLVKTLGFGYVASGSTSPTIRVSPYFSAVTDPPGFDDIIGHLFEDDIDWLADADVTKGCNPPDNTLFCPDDVVTRGQMAAFLKRYLDLPPATEDHFIDDDGSTFEGDINRLAEAGITKGCNPPTNDRFCPDDVITREQMAALIVRALDLTENTHPGFDDVPATNTFVEDIGKLATAGITKGCNPPANTKFCPGDDVTRGQMAAFLHRADQLG